VGGFGPRQCSHDEEGERQLQPSERRRRDLALDGQSERIDSEVTLDLLARVETSRTACFCRGRPRAGPGGNISRLDGAGAILIGDAGWRQLGRYPLKESPVPAIRREGSCQHVIADDDEGVQRGMAYRVFGHSIRIRSPYCEASPQPAQS